MELQKEGRRLSSCGVSEHTTWKSLHRCGNECARTEKYQTQWALLGDASYSKSVPEHEVTQGPQSIYSIAMAANTIA